MPWSRPRSNNGFRRSRLDAVASTVAPARFASWIAATPTPPAPAWISTVSPVVRWPNSNRQSSAVPNATGTQAHLTMSPPSGIGHVMIDRGRELLRVRTPETGRDDALPDGAIGDAFADLADRPRALVADDVRRRRHLAAGAVQRVAALDADRFDVDQHGARRDTGSGTSS